jgi:hypothetical protein
MIFHAAGLGAPLASPPSDPPVVVVDPDFARLAVTSEIPFLAAAHLAMHRDAAQARLLLPAPALIARVVRGLRVALVGAEPRAVGDPVIDPLCANLLGDGRDTGAVRAALAGPPDDAALEANATDWSRAVERTAARVAVVLTLDFDAAGAALAREHRPASLLEPASCLRGLEDFALEDAFAQLRARLRSAS